MVLDPEQLQQVQEGKFTFSSTSNKNKLWPNNQVPYTIESSLRKLSDLYKIYIYMDFIILYMYFKHCNTPIRGFDFPWKVSLL